MKSGFRLRPKGSRLMRLSQDATNGHQISMKSEVSAPTIYRLFSDEKVDGVYSLDMRIIPNIFIDGMGIAPEEFMDLRLSDLFDLVNANGETVIE